MESLLNRIKESLVKYSENQVFCFGGEFYSYKDLNVQIYHIIRLFQDKKLDFSVGRNIGVVTNYDIQTYASLIACWFLGFAYVPINPSIPWERNKAVIREAEIDWILSSSDNVIDKEGKIKALNVILTNEKRNPILQETILPPCSEDRNAYIIFTSGSTGIPKGVPITLANLTAFVENFISTGFTINSNDRCLQMFELTFDVSISSFLMPLLQGACIYPVSDEGIRYMQVLKLIQQYQLTSIQIVPSVIRLAGPLLRRVKFPWVKNCILTGEATSVDLIPEWRTCIYNAKIFNFYGPTEATIYCSFYELEESEQKNYHGMLSIGKAMGNTEILVLDEHQHEVGVDVKGELYIAGAQLSFGYLNNTIQSTNSFIPLPCREGNIFYKSGDMAYKDREGDIFYCGRFDNQVKINGFRIELGEIEFLVRDKFELNNVVIMVEGKSGASELILILETGQSEFNERILNYLRDKLPRYMVPCSIVLLNQFPLTSSGKTDRRKIKEIAAVGVG